MIEQYEHHGHTVSVQTDLRGRHRDHCLCCRCDHFHPGQIDNCRIAAALYEICCGKIDDMMVVTPVWECEAFRPIQVQGEKDVSEDCV